MNEPENLLTITITKEEFYEIIKSLHYSTLVKTSSKQKNYVLKNLHDRLVQQYKE